MEGVKGFRCARAAARAHGGDDGVLVSGNHPGRNSAVGVRQSGARLSRYRPVALEAQPGATVKNRVAHVGSVLTDAAGKDQRINTAQNRGQAADLSHHAAHEQCNGVSRLWGLAGRQLAHVTRNTTGDAQQPAFVIQQMLQRLRTHAVLAHQVQQHAGVQAPRARAHQHTVQGTEAHGCAATDPVVHTAQTCAIAQMSNDCPPLCRTLIVVREHAGDVFVRQAVKAIAPKALRGERRRQAETGFEHVQSVVKRGIETGELHQPAVLTAQIGHGCQAQRLMQRRQRNKRLHVSHEHSIDPRRHLRAAAPMNDTVRSGANLPVCVALDPAHQVGQRAAICRGLV